MAPVPDVAQLQILAMGVRRGSIVVLGPLSHRSVVALVNGASAKHHAKARSVFIIDTDDAQFDRHQDATHAHAPTARASLLSEILDAGFSDAVSLVDLPASMIASWREPIGLLVIDHDYLQRLRPVALDTWIKQVVDGGHIVLSNASFNAQSSDSAIGSYLSSGYLESVGTQDQGVLLQKRGSAFWAQRRDVSARITARAQQAGLDGANAISRLQYGTFASARNRYLFVETPKAACTSWKAFLVELEGARYEKFARPYHRETTLEMLIHQRRYVDIPTLLDLNISSIEDIWTPDSGWFVFAIVRNPYSRLVSVFENKVRLGEPGYRDLEARFGDRSGYANAKEAFAAFVGEVVSNSALRSRDAHLRSQVELLMPSLIPYSRIFTMENMNEAVSILKNRAGRGEDGLKLASTNESSGSPWRSYYSAEIAAAVSYAYANDFEHFGFNPSDWTASCANFDESPSERIARARIVQRNAMIDHLYDWILDRPKE